MDEPSVEAKTAPDHDSQEATPSGPDGPPFAETMNLESSATEESWAAAPGDRPEQVRDEPSPEESAQVGGRRPEHLPIAVSDAPAEATPARSGEPKQLEGLKRDDARVGLLEGIAKAAVDTAHRGATQPDKPLVVLSELKSLEQADEFVVQAKYFIHDVTVGEPVKALLGIAAVSGPAADATVHLVACFELPLDDLFLWLRRATQVCGIAVGVATGQPVLVVAALKDLIVDEVVRRVKQELVAAMTKPSTDAPQDVAVPTTPGQGPDILELVKLARALGSGHLDPSSPSGPLPADPQPGGPTRPEVVRTYGSVGLVEPGDGRGSTPPPTTSLLGVQPSPVSSSGLSETVRLDQRERRPGDSRSSGPSIGGG